jgi:hypothetical protein
VFDSTDCDQLLNEGIFGASADALPERYWNPSLFGAPHASNELYAVADF